MPFVLALLEGNLRGHQFEKKGERDGFFGEERKSEGDVLTNPG